MAQKIETQRLSSSLGAFVNVISNNGRAPETLRFLEACLQKRPPSDLITVSGGTALPASEFLQAVRYSLGRGHFDK